MSTSLSSPKTVSPSLEGRQSYISESQSGGSWLSLSNSEKPSRRAISLPDESRLRPISTTDQQLLREEATFERADGSVRARGWESVTQEWRDWWHDARDTWVVLEEEASGERTSVPAYNRFDPEYADRDYARLKDLEAGLEDAYGSRLHTAFLTLTGTPRNDLGGMRCPSDHLDDLLASYDSVLDSLRYALDGRRWEYIAVIEPHKSGYAHIHLAVFTDGYVSPSTYEPAIDAHLRNCPIAGEAAHQYESVIDVRHSGGDRSGEGVENLAAYISEYLGLYDGSPMDAPEHVQAFNALLWATGRQRLRKSNGAEEYMQRESEPSKHNWTFIGIAHGPDPSEEEVFEADGGSNGVDWVSIDGSDGVDPPPEVD